MLPPLNLPTSCGNHKQASIRDVPLDAESDAVLSNALWSWRFTKETILEKQWSSLVQWSHYTKDGLPGVEMFKGYLGTAAVHPYWTPIAKTLLDE